jgi:hypothetical protein
MGVYLPFSYQCALFSGWREIAIFFVGKTQISLSVEELRLVRFEIFQQGN